MSVNVYIDQYWNNTYCVVVGLVIMLAIHAQYIIGHLYIL